MSILKAILPVITTNPNRCAWCGGQFFRLTTVEAHYVLPEVDVYTFECRACATDIQLALPNIKAPSITPEQIN